MLHFATLQTLVPVVAWVAPVLLQRFTRTQRPAVSPVEADPRVRRCRGELDR